MYHTFLLNILPLFFSWDFNLDTGSRKQIYGVKVLAPSSVHKAIGHSFRYSLL